MYQLTDIEEGLGCETPSSEFNQSVLDLIEIRNAQNKIGQIVIRSHLLTLPNGINNYVRNIAANHDLHLKTAESAMHAHHRTGSDILSVIFSRGKTEQTLKKLLKGDYSETEIQHILNIKQNNKQDEVNGKCDKDLAIKLEKDFKLYERLSVLNEIYFFTWSLHFIQTFFELEDIAGFDFRSMVGFNIQSFDSTGIYETVFIDKNGEKITIAELTNLQLDLNNKRRVALRNVSKFLAEDYMYLSEYMKRGSGDDRLSFYYNFRQSLFEELVENINPGKKREFLQISEEYTNEHDEENWKRYINLYGLKIPISNSVYRFLRINNEL